MILDNYYLKYKKKWFMKQLYLYIQFCLRSMIDFLLVSNKSISTFSSFLKMELIEYTHAILFLLYPLFYHILPKPDNTATTVIWFSNTNMKFNNNTIFKFSKISQPHQPLTSHLKIYYKEIIAKNNFWKKKCFKGWCGLKSNY